LSDDALMLCVIPIYSEKTHYRTCEIVVSKNVSVENKWLMEGGREREIVSILFVP
jgi:transposase-like protein